MQEFLLNYFLNIYVEFNILTWAAFYKQRAKFSTKVALPDP